MELWFLFAGLNFCNPGSNVKNSNIRQRAAWETQIIKIWILKREGETPSIRKATVFVFTIINVMISPEWSYKVEGKNGFRSDTIIQIMTSLVRWLPESVGENFKMYRSTSSPRFKYPFGGCNTYLPIQNGFSPYENTDFIERVLCPLMLPSPDFCSYTWLCDSVSWDKHRNLLGGTFRKSTVFLKRDKSSWHVFCSLPFSLLLAWYGE